MKLYTREQMIEAFNYGKKLEGFDWIGDMIDSLTSVELPSDEEIVDKAKDIYPINVGGDMWMANRDEVNKSYKQEGFTEGAKWVIEQIKQQDK